MTLNEEKGLNPSGDAGDGVVLMLPGGGDGDGTSEKPLTILADDWVERAMLDLDTRDHYEKLFQQSAEELYQANRDRLPFAEFSSDAREDVAGGIAMDYVRWQLGRDPGGDAGLWPHERANYAFQEFGYDPGSDMKLLPLLIGKVRDEQEAREAGEKELGAFVLKETVAREESGWWQGGKSFLGGAADATLAAAQGAMTQLEGFSRKQAEFEGVTDKAGLIQMREQQKLLEETLREQDFRYANEPGGPESNPARAGIVARLAEVDRQLVPLIEEGKRNASNSAWSDVADEYGRSKDWLGERRKEYAEFYRVSPEFQESFIGKVTYGAGQMLPQVVAAELPGIGMAALQSQAFENAYDDAKASAERNGEVFDPEKAYAYAYVSSLSGMLLEKAGIDSALGRWMKTGGEKTLKNVLKRAAVGFFGEGSTEVAQGVVNDALARGMGIDAGRNPFDLTQRLNEFLVGGTLGGGMAGMHAGGEMVWRAGERAAMDQQSTKGLKPYDDRAAGGTITLGGKGSDASGSLSTGNANGIKTDDVGGTLFRGRSQGDDASDSGGSGGSRDAARIFARPFHGLGVRVVHKEIGGGVAARVGPRPDGSIILEVDGNQLAADELEARKRGIKADVFFESTLGEELIHGAHLVALRKDWEATGRPGGFDEFVKAENRKVFGDLRSTLESPSLTLEERTKLEGALAAVYHSYYTPFGREMNISPAGIFERIENEGRTVGFVGEFLRQAVQLKRQGEIRETVLAAMARRLGEWVRRAIGRIKETLPEAFEGRYGRETQETLRRIEETLDSLEGKPPLPAQGVEFNQEPEFFEARASDSENRKGAKPKPKQEEEPAKKTGTTRFGVGRRNPSDWRKTRDLWDSLGYGDLLSSQNRDKIARGKTPVVDETWIAFHPEDTGLIGSQIRMHHVRGLPLTVPLPVRRHLDAHMPGGFERNTGGPGSQLPLYLKPKS